jgi:hypothetical protein
MDTGNWVTAKNTPDTVFVVGKYATTVTGNFYTGRNGVYCYSGLATAGNGHIAIGAGGTEQILSTSAIDTTSFHVFTELFNGASSALYIDGITSPIAMGTTGSVAWPGLRLGTNSTASTAWLDGEIAEIIIYSGALSTDNIAGVMVYLKDKYGIS